MSEAIIIDEAAAIREEPRQVTIDGQLTECLSVILKASATTADIERGSKVKFRGNYYIIYEKRDPQAQHAPIVYLTLLNIGSEKKAGKK